MPALVVDASALVELLLNTPLGKRVGAALRGGSLAAPAHVDAEVFSALGRLARAGHVEEHGVGRVLGQLARAPIARYAIAPLLDEAWKLRHNVAQRDALYVVTARRLGAPLVTTDGRLAGAPRLGVTVTVLGPER